MKKYIKTPWIVLFVILLCVSLGIAVSAENDDIYPRLSNLETSVNILKTQVAACDGDIDRIQLQIQAINDEIDLLTESYPSNQEVTDAINTAKTEVMATLTSYIDQKVQELYRQFQHVNHCPNAVSYLP